MENAMRKMTSALVAIAIAAGSTGSALAGPKTCIEANMVNRTSVPDKHTILFHMDNGTVWRNTLAHDCPDLKYYGFVYNLGGQNEICSNLQTITVLRTHMTCMLGEFTKDKADKS